MVDQPVAKLANGYTLSGLITNLVDVMSTCMNVCTVCSATTVHSVILFHPGELPHTKTGMYVHVHVQCTYSENKSAAGFDYLSLYCGAFTNSYRR